MKRYTLACLFLVTTLVAAAEQHPPTFPSEIAAALQSDIPEGWTVKADSSCITISRDAQITLLNPVSLPGGDLEKLLRDFGHKTDYLIVLTFRERMTDEQYAQLKANRDRAIKKIADNQKIDGKTKYGMMRQERNRHPLPTHFNSRFSIYLHRTDPPPLQVYPKSAADERAKILEAVSKLMTKHEDHSN